MSHKLQINNIVSFIIYLELILCNFTSAEIFNL